jgi:hypothetical protein
MARHQKYVLLFCGTAEDAAASEALSPEELRQRYGEVGRWFQAHHDKILHSDQLQPPTTATTVRHRWSGGEPTITDGPFPEAKEAIGGYASMDVADLDEALRIARTWPGRLRKPGPMQLQAAIAACHAEAPTWSDTDWPQILVLYDMLLGLAPSPIARLNRAVAVRHVARPEVALAEVRALEPELDGYYLWHAVYAELLLEVGQRELAGAAGLRAPQLTDNPGEQSLLRRRLATDAC